MAAMRNGLLLLHIIFVSIWLGANLLQGFVSPYVSKANKEARLWWAQTQGIMARIWYNVAGIGVLLTGILLVVRSGDDAIDFSDTFVTVGFLAVIVGAALGMSVFGPGSRQLVEAIENDDTEQEAELSKKLGLFGGLDSLIIIVTIWMMIDKTGLL